MRRSHQKLWNEVFIQIFFLHTFLQKKITSTSRKPKDLPYKGYYDWLIERIEVVHDDGKDEPSDGRPLIYWDTKYEEFKKIREWCTNRFSKTSAPMAPHPIAPIEDTWVLSRTAEIICQKRRTDLISL